MVTIENIADWMAAKLPHTVGTWNRGLLVNWLAHQWAKRAMAVVVHGQSKILGVAVAVRCEAPDMDDPWTPWNDRGNCLFVHHVATEHPEALRALMAMLVHRVPDWERLRIHATRRGRRVRVPHGVFHRTWRRGRRQRV